MMVRLGFAVAAHLEPEILIVDEVLAVGDAEFQEKCLGKMKSVSGEGRTVLFVSHNIQAIKTICNKGLLLENGKIKCDSTIENVISEYVKSSNIIDFEKELDPDLASINIGDGHIKKIRLVNSEHSGSDFFYQEPIKIEFEFETYVRIDDYIADVRIVSKEGAIVGYAMPKYDNDSMTTLETGKYRQFVEMENNLQPDIYFLDVGIHYGKGLSIHYYEKILQIRVLSLGTEKGDYPVTWIEGNFRPSTKWRIEKA